MDDKTMLGELEALAERLNVTVRYEPLKVEGSIHAGGFCRVKGQDYIIINKKAATADKIHVLVTSLRKCDLHDLYILPSLRKVLDDD
ncbi:MAG: hypothetical protein PHN75_01315 [Syntrophales bacterium]|nr:hypothetical protein [Syntrophales bacterium]